MLTRAFIGLASLVLLSGLGLLVALRQRATTQPVPAVRQVKPGEARQSAGGKGEERYLGVVTPEEAVDLSSRVEGRLEAVKVQVGDRVRQGAVLATLDTRGLRQDLAMVEAELVSAQAELEVARLSLEQAREQLARREDPRQLSTGAISEEELAAARYAQRLAAAKVQAAQGTLQERQARAARIQQDIAEATLRAPFEGVVSSRLVDPGALVRSGQAILHLLRAGPPRVRFAVPEQQVHRLAVGQRVRVALPAQGLTLAGHVSHLAPEVDTAARMMFAVADLEPAAAQPHLASGAVVRVSLAPEGGSP